MIKIVTELKKGVIKGIEGELNYGNLRVYLQKLNFYETVNDRKHN